MPVIVSFPDPFLLCTFCACAVKRGGEGREGSGDKAYPSTDPGMKTTSICGQKHLALMIFITEWPRPEYGHDQRAQQVTWQPSGCGY